jgi:hypothetical protein
MVTVVCRPSYFSWPGVSAEVVLRKLYTPIFSLMTASGDGMEFSIVTGVALRNAARQRGFVVSVEEILSQSEFLLCVEDWVKQKCIPILYLMVLRLVSIRIPNVDLKIKCPRVCVKITRL